MEEAKVSEIIHLVDYSTALWSVLGLALALGMFFFSIRLSFFFRGGIIARGWFAFALSAVLLIAISILSTAQALQLIELPSRWREGGAFIFRLSLFFALFEVYRAWRKLGK